MTFDLLAAMGGAMSTTAIYRDHTFAAGIWRDEDFSDLKRQVLQAVRGAGGVSPAGYPDCGRCDPDRRRGGRVDRHRVVLFVDIVVRCGALALPGRACVPGGIRAGRGGGAYGARGGEPVARAAVFVDN